ncbi:MAG: hypothetical protein NW201_11345 [Gemmatimonadales bacterium]|nr:hypothetical protein [Gemmatimonadales bacterium]
MRTRIGSLVFVSLPCLLAACGDGAAPAGGNPGVAFQVASSASSANPMERDGAVALADVVTNLGGATISIDTLQIVVRRLKLDRTDASCPDNVTDSDNDDNRCPDFRTGPFLLNVPLVPGATAQFTQDLPAGQYNKVRFKIHKPSNRPGDAAFLAANPLFSDKTILVRGSFTAPGQAPVRFVWWTDMEIEQKIDLVPPLTLAAGGPTPLTLLVDPTNWFRNQAGDGLITPAQALGGSLRSRIENNIRASFRAFRDANRNGRSDD